MKKRMAALFLVIALFCTLTACRAGSITVTVATRETETETEPSETDAPVFTEPTAPENETTLPPETEEPTHDINIYDIFSDSAEIEGDVCYYSSPCIRIDNQELTEVNEQIWKDLHENVYVPYVRETLREYGNTDIQCITYDYNESHGILSVMCYSRSYHSEWQGYYPYNILISEKRSATRAEVLAAFGMTEDEYCVKAADIMGCKLWDDMQNYLENIADQPDLAEEAYQTIRMTIAEDNVYESVPFVMDNGELYICANIFTPAGMGYYTALLPMNYPVSGEYYSFIKNIT